MRSDLFIRPHPSTDRVPTMPWLLWMILVHYKWKPYSLSCFYEATVVLRTNPWAVAVSFLWSMLCWFPDGLMDGNCWTIHGWHCRGVKCWSSYFPFWFERHRVDRAFFWRWLLPRFDWFRISWRGNIRCFSRLCNEYAFCCSHSPT
jgi:hypothetical protein